ncbi:MAG: DUF1189 family protein [Acholeplasma sp.]|nr:DUF1189 family protein [Acholeplasma sp.]
MFIVKFFKKSFQFSDLPKNVHEKMWKFIVYFLLLLLISNFPFIYETVKNDGSKLDFVIEDFDKSIPLNWEIPESISIVGGRLINNDDNKVYTNKHYDITYIINNLEVINVENHKNSIILSKDSIIYVDNEGNYIEALGYKGFTDTFSFKELNLASGDEKIAMFKEFSNAIEKSFKDQIVLYSILRNIVSQLLINILYVLILAGIVMFFKFGYQKFFSYQESIKFVILSMGLPAILTFIVGLVSFAFSPVVFQLSMGMVVMIVMLVFGRRNFS